MDELKKTRQAFDSALIQNQRDMVSFGKLLDGISEDGLKGLNQEKVLAEFKNNRHMADYAVLLLAQASESLAHENPDLDEIREILRLGILTIQLQRIAFTQASNAGFEISGKKASNRGKTAADARHDKAGGSRSKAEEMRLLWASGRFTSRDRCAEEECGAVGLSYSTARKALRGTPDPS